MSIFGKLFGKGDPPAAPSTPAAAAPPAAPFDPDPLPIDPAAEPPPDPDMSERLRALIGVSPDARDESWQRDFFSTLWSAAVVIPDSKPFVGPDGFPYLRLDLPVAEQFVGHNLAALARPCLEAGSGAVLFADPDAREPAWVLSMGTIESLVRYRDWRGDPVDLEETQGGSDSGPVTLKAGSRVLHGIPSADYLSPEAARALDRHLKDPWQVAEPRVRLMMSNDLQPTRSLVFNVPHSAFRDDEHAQLFLGHVSWFLPPSRSIMLLPEGDSGRDMMPLSEIAKN